MGATTFRLCSPTFTDPATISTCRAATSFPSFRKAHEAKRLGGRLSILELAQAIANVAGFKGRIETDPSKPDGTPRKLMSADKLKSMGWRPRVPLAEGLASTYAWFCSHVAAA